MRQFLALAVLVFVAATGRADPPTADQIQGWIRDLDSPSFRTRESAAKQLWLAGADAAPALAKAAKAGGAEVSDRALRLLGEMAEGNDPKAEAAARRQLRRLADGESRVAADARSILNRRRNAALAAFLFAGVAYDEVGSGIVRIDFDNSSDVPGVAPLLKEFPDLESLSASTSRFTDAQAKYLADLPNLRELNLYRSNIGDEGLKHLTGLKNLRWLPMGGTKVTDAGLKVISGMTQLEYVGVRGDNITDAGLVHLKGLTNLTGLYLGETKVTDAGLKHIAGLTRLKTLYLHNTAVTDAGLEHLKDLKDLRDLYLAKTKTTAAGRARLKETLPELRVPDVDE
jgi:Leucine-rich repeat (LRR) protein